MYYYILYSEEDPLPEEGWTIEDGDVPAFSSSTLHEISDTLHRFQCYDSVVSSLLYLPRKEYLVLRPIPDVEMFVDNDTYLFIRTTSLDTEPSLLQWLEGWYTL